MVGFSPKNFSFCRNENPPQTNVGKFPSTVFRRYALSLAGVVCAVLCAAGIAFAIQSYRDAENHMEGTHALQTQLARDRTLGLLEEIERNLRVIASIPWSATGLTQDDRATEYRRVISTLVAVQEISLVSPEGIELAAVSRSRPVTFGSGIHFDKELISRARSGEPTYSEVRLEPGRTTPFVYLALADKGSSEQVSVAKISLQTLSEALARIATSPASQSFIVDAAGLTVAHSNRLQALRIDALKTDVAVQQAIGASRAGALNGNATSIRDGETLFNSWQSLKNPSWLFFISQPKSKLLVPVYKSLLWSLALLGLGLSGALAASYWLARKMTRPIIALSKSANEFANGNLDHRIPAAQIYEFQNVAQSFNRMAGDLKVLTTDLESKVQEKTAQLSSEFALRETQTKELTKLEERARIMRDIHDGVGGHLVALLGAAKREQLDSKAIEAMAQDALVDFRIAIDSMSPTETDLVTTLANLRFRLQPRLAASQLASDWKFDEFPPDLKLSREVLFHLQRIVAEAITNIAKHARGATRADVAAKWDAAHLRVIIEILDDGAGFAQGLIAGGGGRGIANMRTRAGLAGGELELISAGAGSGAIVRLLIPAEIGDRG